MIQKIYKTDRLILRRLDSTDFDAWLISQNRALPAKNKFDVTPCPEKKRTKAFFMENVRRHARLAKQDRVYIWNIFLKKSKELVGHIDVATIYRDPHQMANLGYYIINSYRGNGYATEAIEAIIHAVFADLKFHRIEASLDLDNRAGIALARRAGLQREGIKKHYWLQNGQWDDQLIYIATPELYKILGEKKARS